MKKHYLVLLAGSTVLATGLLTGCGEGRSESTSLKKPFDTRKVTRSRDWTWNVGTDATFVDGKTKKFSLVTHFHDGIPKEVQHLQTFIDVDNNPNTGFSYGEDSWRISGADYLIEDGSLYESTSTSKWRWNYIGEMSFVRRISHNKPIADISTTNKNLVALFDSSHINVTIEPFDKNWGSTYSTISTESIDVERKNTHDDSTGDPSDNLAHARDLIPEDSNVAFARENDILYLTDVRTEDGGKNRAIRVDTKDMTFKAITLQGSNPHSIDRAGSSDKFYLRTQNSNTISVVNFKNNSEKLVHIGRYFARTAGATNLKYNIQLISMHNAPVISIIDIKTDKILATVGDSSASAPNMANGHPLWFDEDHFGLIDRVNKTVTIFEVTQNGTKLSFTETDSLRFNSPVHIIHKTANITSIKDLNTFYIMGEGDVSKGLSPFVANVIFRPKNGTFYIDHQTSLSASHRVVKGVNPVLHHGGTSPDGKYFFASVLDGKTYILNTESMKVVKTLKTGLGAGHVNFSKEENVAIVTNHFADNVTIIDLTTLKIKAQIVISKSKFHENDRHLLQLHNPIVSKDGRYFLTAASHDGDVVKIDLRALKIDSKLHVGGLLEQTSS